MLRIQEYASLFIGNAEDMESILPLRLICNGRWLQTLQTAIMEHELGRMHLDTSLIIVHSRNVSRGPNQCERMEFYEAFSVFSFATLSCPK